MKYLVLDTNVYLHYKDFEQVDWKSLLNDEVTVCVPQRVFEEIDKHKDQSRGKVQRKAKQLSARFSEIFLQGVAPRVPVEVMNHPLSTAFDDPQYHKEISDDWIILSALQSSYDNADIVIASGDNGILLKAKHHGLGFYMMPDDLLLAEEASEEEKELRQLKQQLAKYETRRPDPEVEFVGETSLLTIVKPHFINIKEELAQYETELKNSYPYESTDEEPFSEPNYLYGQIANLAYSTAGQREEYNKELDEFFEKKLKLKEWQLCQQFMEQRIHKLSFILSNGGTASLGDTTVFLYFPQEVNVYSQNSKVVVRVVDPQKPILKNNLNIYNTSLMTSLKGKSGIDEDIDIWSAKKTLDHHDFKYFSHRLTHNMCLPLENREDIYIDIAQCGNFSIKWKIIDSELIDPVEGELHVVLKEAENNS